MSTSEPPADQPPFEPPSEPPAGGYGAPPPPGSRWDLGAALSYGWVRFQANIGQILLAALVLLGALVVAGAIGFGLTSALLDQASVEYDPETGAFRSTEGSGTLATLMVTGLVVAITFLLVQIVAAGVIRGALDITEGRPFEVADLFRSDRIGAVVITSLIVAAATAVGTALCYLPGLVVAFATSYSLFFVLDRNMSPVEAITASLTLVKDNLANALVWFLVGGIVVAAGVPLCFVGLLATIPIVLIGTAYTYKSFTGQPIA